MQARGSVVGVDVSEPMLEHAHAFVAESGLASPPPLVNSCSRNGFM